MRRARRALALSLLAFSVFGTARAQRVVRYEPKDSDLKLVYGPAQPVATLRPGDVLETRTADCFGGVIQKTDDSLSKVKGDNPLTGPFAIEGAEPGDTLVVKILDLQVDGPRGVGAMAPGFGAINWTNYTPMLNPPLPERVWIYDVDSAAGVATFHARDSNFSLKIPLTPFFGCIGVAPPLGESRASITPGEWGGNLDASEARAGNTVYLPVNAKGALLFLGDGHAAQGDGEIAGTGIEVPLRARVQVDLIKGKAIRWPRFESDRMLMTVGAYRPLDDALRIAFTELVHWLHDDYAISELDAYELLGKVGKIHLTEMVDPNYVIVAGIDKQNLPPKR